MDGKNCRRRFGLGALLTVVSVVALAGAGGAGALGRYGDQSGDGNGAADVTGVAVASDANGQILFTISTASNPEVGGGVVLLLLDTDANPASGMPGAMGAEYLFLVDAEGYGFLRWTGSGLDLNPPSSTVRVLTNGNGAVFSVNRSELGGTGSLNFGVRTARGDPTSGQSDAAPDDGTFNYTLAAGGPDIREVNVRATPNAGPRAGRPFVVQPTALVLPPNGGLLATTPAPESYRCVAKLAAKTLRGTGTGGCTFAIPKKAKGKRLSISLGVSYQGATKTMQLAYKVR